MGRTNPDFVQAAIELRAAMILMWNVVGEGDVIYGINMNGMARAGEENGAVASACLISDLMREVSGEGGVLSAIQAPVALLVRLAQNIPLRIVLTCIAPRVAVYLHSV